MPAFVTESDQPLTMFEVFLPKRMEYQSKLYEALQCGLQIGKVREFLLANGSVDPVAEKLRIQSLIPTVSRAYTDDRISHLQPVYFGFSLYEVDGVFMTDAAVDPADRHDLRTQERTQVVRLFFKAEPVYRAIRHDTELSPRKAARLIDQVREFQRECTSWSEEDMVATYLKRRKLADKSGRLRHYLTAIEQWRTDVLLFIFGYLVGKITEDLSIDESEIWVTSHSSMAVNVVRRIDAAVGPVTPDQIAP